jgi:hypothetical protein
MNCSKKCYYELKDSMYETMLNNENYKTHFIFYTNNYFIICVAHEDCRLEIISNNDSSSIIQLTFSNSQSNKFNGKSSAKEY